MFRLNRALVLLGCAVLLGLTWSASAASGTVSADSQVLGFCGVSASRDCSSSPAIPSVVGLSIAGSDVVLVDAAGAVVLNGTPPLV